MDSTTPYGGPFFDDIQAGARRSADAVVPIVLRILDVGSVADLGCGTGSWLASFLRHGIDDVRGFDGDWVDPGRLEIPREAFTAHDLAQPLRVGRTYDLALSLEVAEHLPPAAAETLVESLTRLAPAVLFSAGIPEQDGTNHVNLRWPQYWRDLFAARGYQLVDCLRHQTWSNDAIEFWYRQNMLLFATPAVIAASPTLAAEIRVPRQIDLVHPLHWQQVTHQAKLDRAALADVRAELAAAHECLARPWTIGRIARGVMRRVDIRRK
jgi:SAM-dependent methyltransferase